MTERFSRFFVVAAVAGTMTALSLQPAAADNDDGDDRDEGRGHHGILFSDLDADGDGQLTEEEFAAAKLAWLQKLDANGDGALSPEEAQAAIMERLSKAASRMTEKMFRRLDANEDGLIDADELGSMRSGRGFDHMDSDDDGMISEEEFDHKGHKGKKTRRRHRDK